MEVMSKYSASWQARVFYSGRLALAALLALAFLLTSDTTAQALNPRPICDTCRRFTDKSPSRIIGFIEIGNHSKKLDACSVFCFIEMLEDQRSEPSVVYVTDYETFDTDQHMPLVADQASYLYGCNSGDDEKTNTPYAYAFSSEKTATKFQEELGGELLDWDELVEAVTELTDEWEPPHSDREYRPFRGKRQQNNRDDDGGNDS